MHSNKRTILFAVNIARRKKREEKEGRTVTSAYPREEKIKNCRGNKNKQQK
jgi:hypothetical protein